jgi:hypothetical protein
MPVFFKPVVIRGDVRDPPPPNAAVKLPDAIVSSYQTGGHEAGGGESEILSFSFGTAQADPAARPDREELFIVFEAAPEASAAVEVPDVGVLIIGDEPAAEGTSYEWHSYRVSVDAVE